MTKRPAIDPAEVTYAARSATNHAVKIARMQASMAAMDARLAALEARDATPAADTPARPAAPRRAAYTTRTMHEG